MPRDPIPWSEQANAQAGTAKIIQPGTQLSDWCRQDGHRVVAGTPTDGVVLVDRGPSSRSPVNRSVRHGGDGLRVPRRGFAPLHPRVRRAGRVHTEDKDLWVGPQGP